MAEYVDLVLCKYSEDSVMREVFQAPAWSCGLEPGRQVMVDTKLGKRLAIVIYSMTTSKNSDAYNMIMKLVGTDKPFRKVLSRVTYDEFTYPKEEEDGTESCDKVQTEDVE